MAETIQRKRSLEGIIPQCCWYLQSLAKLKRSVELNDFNQRCYDTCDGYNPQCQKYLPIVHFGGSKQ